MLTRILQATSVNEKFRNKMTFAKMFRYIHTNFPAKNLSWKKMYLVFEIGNSFLPKINQIFFPIGPSK